MLANMQVSMETVQHVYEDTLTTDTGVAGLTT